MVPTGTIEQNLVNIVLINTETQGVLSPLAATGWTALGAASAGLFIAAIFALHRWLTSDSGHKAELKEDTQPLLPDSEECGPTG
jgi:hypothetical protein